MSKMYNASQDVWCMLRCIMQIKSYGTCLIYDVYDMDLGM